MGPRFAHPLPVPLMLVVGREADLKRILDLLQNPSSRLVTILGAGGVGKTRLAIELAHILHTQFHDGAVFVPLAPLTTIDEFLPTLAVVVGVQLLPGGDLQEAVLAFLANREIFLVLDNFEHLLAEATLILDILAHSPQTKVLITSREKLNLEPEVLNHLSGLQLPPHDCVENLRDYGAVSLFLQKAVQASPGFFLNADTTAPVVQICQFVTGNPLGILLAATGIICLSILCVVSLQIKPRSALSQFQKIAK
jgi:predicted ATPase